MISVAVDRQRVARFESFWTHFAWIVPREVDVFNVVGNVLLSSGAFAANDTKPQVVGHPLDIRFYNP